MELHYQKPRIDPSADPWDESFAGCLHPVDSLLEPDGNFTYRLIPELRQAAQTLDVAQTMMDPIPRLARAAEAFYFADNLAETVLDKRAASARATAFADLAVTGRMVYDVFKLGLDLPTLKALVTDLLNARTPVPPFTDAQVDAAMNSALDRAYNVAWALRAPPAQQAALRAKLGWIAVSGEDDKPHRPVNVPPPPYEQHEIVVSSQGQQITTRFFIASAVPPANRVAPQQPRQVPDDPPPPTVPNDHDVILFLHGHSSGAEEALAIIPELLKTGLDRNVNYSVLTLDLPNNGYSLSFDHLAFSPTTQTTYPKDPADQTHITTPILDFIENFIVDFVDSLPTSISNRIVAVIGGSLGGNLCLRLGRRDLSTNTWMIPSIVAWSPASVWPPKVAHIIDYLAPNSCFDRCREVEQTRTRDDFFYQSYEESNALGLIHPQPDYWYRENYALKQFHISQSKFARYEIYDSNFRQWHWRVAGEQLIYSHLDNEIFRDQTTPVRITKNVVPTLLAAGAYDNYIGTHIYGNTITLSELMTTPGRRLLMNTSGHSIHFERPRYFANEIVKFLQRRTWFITCVTKKDGKIQSYGLKTNPNDDMEMPVQRTLDWCIEAMEQGDDFYIAGADGSQAYVVVSHREHIGVLGDSGGENRGYYLKTISDDTTVNNIDTLPDCGP
jgi:pimeloyl-ACP methyl ester carboxylesterase